MVVRLLPFLLLVVFLSCKKESVKPISPLLSKMETTLAGEVVATTIEYNNDGKPVFMQALGSTAARPVNIITRFVRNAQGTIQKIIIKNPQYLNTFNTDSIIYTTSYSGTNGRYTSMVNYLFHKNGTTEYDSTYFTYDAAGTVTKATKLRNNGSLPGFAEVERNEFTYENGNLMRCKNYILSSLFLEQTVTYDTKVNPMGFGTEWILIGSTRNNRKFEQSSPNNATVISYTQNGTTSTITATFTYLLNDFPTSKTETLANGQQQTSIFTYR